MQSSSATIAIVLTALNTHLINFNMGTAMVIGANVGTTITVLLGSIGGTQPKKRVALSHVIFNLVTGAFAFLLLPWFVWCIKLVFDLKSDSVMALAAFHTLFNMFGVIIFFPFVGLLSQTLFRIVPQRKALLTMFLHKTPTEVADAASAALRNEVNHLFEECRHYCLRMMMIDEKLVFESGSFFETNSKKKLTPDKYYENIKLLHAAIFTYYSQLQKQQLDVEEARDLERLIYASRNMINSIKNFKGIRHNLDEFDGSENRYLNAQYEVFRRRLIELYHNLTRILESTDGENIQSKLLAIHGLVENSDRQFIDNTIDAVCSNRIQEMEISTLLLANRLFTQACRLQIYSVKDLILNLPQTNVFDRAIEKKLSLSEED
jgi:phosphate:Na+ symporter